MVWSDESSGQGRLVLESVGQTRKLLTVFVITQHFLELGQVTVLVSDRNGAHAFDFSQLSILGCELDG